MSHAAIQSLHRTVDATVYDSAMLVALNIRCISRTGKSAKGTQAVEDRYGVQDVGAFRVDRLSKAQFRPVSSAMSELRAFHREHTLKYPTPGYGLLPGRLYHEYLAGITQRIDRFDQAADELCAHWQVIVDDAQQRLGELFDPDEYPQGETVRALIGARVRFAPLPRPENVTLRLPEDELARIRRDTEASVQEGIQGAVLDLAERIRETIEHLRERLSDPNHIFRDSLVESVREMVDMIPKLNVTDDPTINHIADQARIKLTEMPAFAPDTLRCDPAVRRQVHDSAAELLEGLDDYISGFQH